MKKFGEFINESLADQVKVEPKSKASAQAQKMGLTYAGFGRYMDAQGKIAYVVQNGKLLPFKAIQDVQSTYSKAQTANPEKQKDIQAQADAESAVLQKRQKKDADIMAQQQNDIGLVNQQLVSAVTQLDDTQIGAIKAYTTDMHDAVNRYLYKGYDDGTDVGAGQSIADTINTLDTALDQSAAPMPYSTYTCLSNRYDPNKIAAGSQYLFRSYLSSSLEPTVALSGYDANGPKVLLQIDVQQGQKALYLEPYAQQPGDMETLFPRGSVLQVVSGPHSLDGTILGLSDQSPTSLFHCAIIEE